MKLFLFLQLSLWCLSSPPKPRLAKTPEIHEKGAKNALPPMLVQGFTDEHGNPLDRMLLSIPITPPLPCAIPHINPPPVTEVNPPPNPSHAERKGEIGRKWSQD